jgi:hypothetical protein
MGWSISNPYGASIIGRRSRSVSSRAVRSTPYTEVINNTAYTEYFGTLKTIIPKAPIVPSFHVLLAFIVLVLRTPYNCRILVLFSSGPWLYSYNVIQGAFRGCGLLFWIGRWRETQEISLELNVSTDPKAGPADVRVTWCTWAHFCMFFYIVLRILSNYQIIKLPVQSKNIRIISTSRICSKWG